MSPTFRFLLFVFLFVSLSTRADYRYMSLSRLVPEAENAVIGTIVKIDSSYFWLEIERPIFGTISAGTIPIVRFQSWNCGRRYERYKIGQKEVVFFRKSNNEIPEFDYLGYGGGSEFELPISGDSVAYQYGYNRFQKMLLTDFLIATKDYKLLANSIKNDVKKQIKVNWAAFAATSVAHTIVSERNAFAKEMKTESPPKGVITNLEAKYLYEGYDNRLQISVFEKPWDSLYLVVEDAEVSKRDNHFVVNPKGGWARRWMYVYSVTNGDSTSLFEELFDVIPIPEPTLYVSHSKGDSVSIRDLIYPGVPLLGYDMGQLFSNDYLEYKILRYEVEIATSKGESKRVICKNQYCSQDLKDLFSGVKPGNTVRFLNILAQYPDKTVRKVKDKTFIAYQDDE